MNRSCLHWVFSRRLGMRVAVAETARGCGSRGQGATRRRARPGAASPAGVPAGSASVAGLLPLALLVAGLACPPAAAQSAPASTARPPVRFGSQFTLPAARALPQPFGTSRGADGVLRNDPSLRGFIANPAHRGQVRWQVSADGRSATLNQGDIDRLVLNWDSFDIAAGHSVTFLQSTDPSRSVSALNRVWSSDPSVILGSLKANRELILVNPNGVYFGRGAVVDTGKFVASALGIADAVFERGLRNVTDGSAVFSTEGTDHLPTALADGADRVSAAVSVEAGAEIRTAAGGDVLLVAPRVVNAGRIATPDGQTVLAAGNRVYLMSASDPAQRGLIVAVDAIPAAGTAQPDTMLGVVENRATGTAEASAATSSLAQQVDEIRAERGQVNLVGLTVRQAGLLNATTAVRGANGGIYLQAMAGTQAVVGGSTGTAAGFGLTVEAGATARIGNGGGTVEVAAGSRTAVLPDSGGATQVDAELFNPSRIRVEGGAVAVGSTASLLAPGGRVELLAAMNTLSSPLFNTGALTAPAQGDASRIVIAPDALLSVAGLREVAVDGNRNQGRQRLFRIELADVPVQRDGPLYRSELFFDLRQAAQVAVADVTAAGAGIGRTAQELSTQGGSLRLETEGALVVGAGARLDVSGGSVAVGPANIETSVLSQAGRSVLFSAAAAGLGTDALSATRQRLAQSAYTEGRDAGSLALAGRRLVLQGQVAADVLQGERQQAGTDAPAAGASLRIGRQVGASQTFYLPQLALLPEAVPTLAADQAALLQALWADPLGAALADVSPQARLGLGGLGRGGSATGGLASGLGSLSLLAADIAAPAHAGLDLGPGGLLQISAERIALDLEVTAPGGLVQINTTRAAATPPAAADGSGGTGDAEGDIRLAPRTRLDVAGRWNQPAGHAGGSGVQPIDAVVDGGRISVRAAGSLRVEPGAVLDVSAGASRSAAGRVQTGDAGALALSIGVSPLLATTLELQAASLRGFGWDAGASLTLGTPGLQFGGDTSADAAGRWRPEAALFTERGFGSISLQAHGDVRLAAGTQLAPALRVWQLAEGHAQASSGAMREAVATPVAPDARLLPPAPVDLSLAAARPLQPAVGQLGGSLVVEPGAGIQLAPGAALTLRATRDLQVGAVRGAAASEVAGEVAGEVASRAAGVAATADRAVLQAPGGSITLAIDGQRGARTVSEGGTDPAGFLADQALWLGAAATLDVSGTAQLRPLAGSPGALTGEVLGGGQITLAAQRGYVVAEPGARLRLDGASAAVQADARSPALTVARAAGTLQLSSPEGIVLAADVRARAPTDARGRALADGGRLALDIGTGGVASFTQGPAYPGSLFDNTQGNPIADAQARPRVASVVADAVPAALLQGLAPGADLNAALGNGLAPLPLGLLSAGVGFEALRLGAGDLIRFDVPLALQLPLGVVLDAPRLSAAPGTAVALGGAQVAIGDRTRAVLRLGAQPDLTASAAAADAAPTTLTLRAPTIEVAGRLALQGFHTVTLDAGLAADGRSGGEIRLLGLQPALGDAQGSLAFASDLALVAGSVSAGTASQFSLQGLPATGAGDRGSRLLLSLGAGGAAAAAPLSVYGSLSAQATEIVQGGVLHQPFGSITLDAERTLTLAAGSRTSVSGAGQQALYGSTTNLATWVLPNGQESAAQPLAAGITLRAARIDSAGATGTLAAAVVDASGGGDVLAWEFFPGVGGSRDLLADEGLWAVLPDRARVQPVSAQGGLLTPAGGAGSLAGLAAAELVITQPGGLLAPGAYTLMPARLALLGNSLPAGALLVRATGDAAQPGQALQRLADGSQQITGQLRAAGSQHLDAVGQRFEIAPLATWQARSEIRLSSVSTLLARQSAARGETEPAALPRDAGTVRLLARGKGTGADAAAPGSTWQGSLALGGGGAGGAGVGGGGGGGGGGAAGGRAGTLDVSAAAVALVATAQATPAGAFGITAQALAASQAGSVLLGGLRGTPQQLADGSVQVAIDASGTRALTVDLDPDGDAAAPAQPLALRELLLASSGSLQLAPGTVLQGRAGTQGATVLHQVAASGSGALLGVGSQPLALARDGSRQAGRAGLLTVGAGSRLEGAVVALDATDALALPADLVLAGDALTLSAPRLQIGGAATDAGGPSGAGAAGPASGSSTTLTGSLLATVRSADALTLRAYQGIDIVGSQRWAARDAEGRASAVLGQLVLDTPALRTLPAAAGDGGEPGLWDVAARSVLLRNSSGAQPSASDGASGGSLVLQALPPARWASTGGLAIGPGHLALQTADARLRSSGDILLQGQGELSASGDLQLAAARITAATAAEQSLRADSGRLQIVAEPGARSLGERVGQGASLALQAQSIVQAGVLDLPGGLLRLTATAADPATGAALQFQAGSRSSVAGFSVRADNGHGVSGQPGRIVAQASQGSVAVAGLLDASAAAAGDDGGTLEIRAPQGALVWQGGRLQAAGSGTMPDSSIAAWGGSLLLDLGRLTAPGQLDTLAAAAATGGLSGALELRLRSGDLRLDGTLSARRVALSADAGTLSLGPQARIDARADRGGEVALAAAGDLRLEAGARIEADASVAGGGDVQLASSAGRLGLAAGALIDAGSAGDGSAGSGSGRIVLRAARGADGRSLQVDSLGGVLAAGPAAPSTGGGLQAADVVLEAVRTYRTVTVGGSTAEITAIGSGGNALAGSAGNRTGTLGQAALAADSSRLMAAQTELLDALGVPASERPRLRLAPGVEVQAAGALSISNDWALNNPANGGDNGVLTLRAAGSITLNGSVSDGFNGVAPNAALLDEPRSWSMRLAAGADLGAAQPLAVRDLSAAAEDSGNLVIGAGRLLRTGAGRIDLAAGRDIRFGGGAGNAVPGLAYVAGTLLPDGDGSRAALFAQQSAKPVFTTAGGMLTASALRDLSAPEATQLVGNWLWRSGLASTRAGEDGLYAGGSQLAWWTQFANLRASLGSFGGGGLRVSAGRDILNLQAAAPTQAYATSRVQAEAGLHTLGGGHLLVQAGRDVLGGQFTVGGGSGRLRSGGQIGALAANLRLDVPVLAQMSGASWSADARLGLSLATAFNPTAAPVATADNRVPVSGFYYTWGDGAGLSLRSLAGDVQLAGEVPAPVLGAYGLVSAGGAENLMRVLPPSLHASALGGSLALLPDNSQGSLLFPSQHGQLALWAAGDLRLGSSISSPNLVLADTAVSLWPGWQAPLSSTGGLFTGSNSSISATLADLLPRQGLHADDRVPAQLHAGGSLVLPDLGSGALRLAKAAEIHAGIDIASLRLAGQNLRSEDSTRLSAGRHLLAGARGALEIGGPGALDVRAGGDIDLGASAGVRSVGNQRSAALPATGASIALRAAATGTVDLDALQQRYLQPSPLATAAQAAEHRAALLAFVQAGVAQPVADADAAWALLRSVPAAVQARFAEQVLARAFGQHYLDAAPPTADAVLATLRGEFERLRSHMLDVGRAALAADRALELPGRERLGVPPGATPEQAVSGRAALADWLAALEALRFDALGKALPGQTAGAAMAAIAAAQAAAQADVQQRWRTRVAGALASTPAALEALPATDPQAVAWRAALAQRSGPLYDDFRRDAAVQLLQVAGTAAADFGRRELPMRQALYGLGLAASELAGLGSAVPQAVWPQDTPLIARDASLNLTQSSVLSERGGALLLANPGGPVNVGLQAAEAAVGVVAQRGGDVVVLARDDIQVNTQRITLAGSGDLTLFASNGDIDSGRGANTAVAAPRPQARRSADGVVFERSATTTGSGISKLPDVNGNADGSILLLPAFGLIRALDAFIVGENLVVGGEVSGADNLQSDNATGAGSVTPPPPVAATAPAPATQAGASAAEGNSGRATAQAAARSGLLTVELLGLGAAPEPPPERADCSEADARAQRCRRPAPSR